MRKRISYKKQTKNNYKAQLPPNPSLKDEIKNEIIKKKRVSLANL
jgi:hypothetical protein